MKRMLVSLWLLITCACTACTALPAEERAFAVVLCVNHEELWRVWARVPTYQTGGGYTTISGDGMTLETALAAMDAMSPMQVNLSQLRLLVLDTELGPQTETALQALAARKDMRMQCTVTMTDDAMPSVLQAMQPTVGTRLSKAIDLMVEARMEQGVILPSTLADVLRMGERQSAILPTLRLQDGQVILEGGVSLAGTTRLDAEEIALLSLLLGHTQTLSLMLPDGVLSVRRAMGDIALADAGDVAAVTIAVKATEPVTMPEVAAQQMAEKLLTLLERLGQSGCDALGLGRQAILHCHDMTAWQNLNWPERLRQLQWQVSVQVQGLT